VNAERQDNRVPFGSVLTASSSLFPPSEHYLLDLGGCNRQIFVLPDANDSPSVRSEGIVTRRSRTTFAPSLGIQ
jgi:hypothetical protein